MLTITEQQFRALDDALYLRFEDAAVETVRADLTEEAAGLSDPNLRQFIRACRDRCVSLRLEQEVEVMAFVELGLVFKSTTFDQDDDKPWASVILNNRFLSPIDRADRLLAMAYATQGA